MGWVLLHVGAGTPELALCKVPGFAAQCQGQGGNAQGQVWHLQAMGEEMFTPELG